MGGDGPLRISRTIRMPNVVPEDSRFFGQLVDQHEGQGRGDKSKGTDLGARGTTDTYKQKKKIL